MIALSTLSVKKENSNEDRYYFGLSRKMVTVCAFIQISTFVTLNKRTLLFDNRATSWFFEGEDSCELRVLGNRFLTLWDLHLRHFDFSLTRLMCDFWNYDPGVLFLDLNLTHYYFLMITLNKFCLLY